MPYGLARLSKDLLLVAIGLLLFIDKTLLDLFNYADYNLFADELAYLVEL